MRLFLASDHAGVEFKKSLMQNLKEQLPELELVDLGPQTADSVDYPDFADLVCQAIKTEASSKGLLICGSGQGMALRANKHPHIRAALVYSAEIAALSREHNNANVMCVGARFCSPTDAYNWTKIFLNTDFAEGRHTVRVAKISRPVS
jgi:ribose 5-phosphate isomerase B